MAEQIHRELADQPTDFARLAMQNSIDVNSASIGGLIQPIRHHVGDPAIEREVFAMQPNQISSIIPVGEQFAILKCEGQVPARNVPMETVRDELTEQIREGKLREVASKRCSRNCRNSSTVQNVWNDPQLRAQMPGVVATINGEQIPYSELAEECLLRYGQEVLDVEISHLLLKQALAEGQSHRHRSGSQRGNRATRQSSPASSTKTARPTSPSGSRRPPKSRASRRTSTFAIRSGRRPRSRSSRAAPSR